MLEGGAKFTKSNVRNNDICDELILSKEGMRFDPVALAKERERMQRKLDNDELMREAEMALA